MKIVNIFVRSIILALLISTNSVAQSINLPKEASFMFGDNPLWAQTSYNDIAWEKMQLAKSYTKDSSYAWYRIKIHIPSSLKTKNGKGVKLYLGKIDDADQTFFNGTFIGEMGSFPPHYTTQWNQARIYIIPENLINWDKENLIAVRIYNLIGGMGMWEGPYKLEPLGWMDEVTVSHETTENIKNGFNTKIIFTNKTGSSFNGKAQYWVKDKTGAKVLFSGTKPVQLKGEIGSLAAINFPVFNTAGQHAFQIGYRITDNNSTQYLLHEQVYVTVNNLVIPFAGEVKPLIKNKILNEFTPASFQNQQFAGYLNTRFTQNLEQRLLKVDEFGLIGSYLQRPGIHPWAGEHVGKYLETACNVWKLTHNPALKKQMDRLMFELISSQKPDGYLGTYTPDLYWTSWDVWSHKYNLHGLLAYYSTTGYKPALVACQKMGDLLCRTFGNKPGQIDILTAGTHMGMAATSVLDAMVELYKYTGNKKYLDFCYYILDAWEEPEGPKVLSTILATGKVKKVGNGKAYEMLSNYVGLAKLYQVTGNPKFLQAVEAAWQDVVSAQLYITGTASSHEYFQDDQYLPAGANDNMGEGCVTTTWIQLNQNLFTITGDLKYLNQLEKSVYNHLLAAENPLTGCVSYYTPLMDKKPFTCFITCCQSSVPRGIALIPNFTFGTVQNAPAVLLYEPAEYKHRVMSSGKSIDLHCTLKGDFPESGNFSLVINASASGVYPISLRVPDWCESYIATTSGEVYPGIPNQYLTITRKWKIADTISIRFNMPVRMISGGKSYPGSYAWQRGPQILAWDKSLNNAETNNLVVGQSENILLDKIRLVNAPASLPARWIGKQAYAVELPGKNGNIVLVPFAEASQTEGEIKVWLPLKLKE